MAEGGIAVGGLEQEIFASRFEMESRAFREDEGEGELGQGGEGAAGYCAQELARERWGPTAEVIAEELALCMVAELGWLRVAGDS
jgi:hypothetical protein